MDNASEDLGARLRGHERKYRCRLSASLNRSRHRLSGGQRGDRSEASAAATGRLLQQSEIPRLRLSARAAGRGALARHRVRHQRARKSGRTEHHQRLRLSGEHGGLRRQPVAHPLQRDRQLRPGVPGRPAQYAAGLRPGHRVRDRARLRHRHRAAVAQLAGRPARRRLCRARSATCRCCSRSCSGISRCSVRCRDRARACALFGGHVRQQSRHLHARRRCSGPGARLCCAGRRWWRWFSCWRSRTWARRRQDRTGQTFPVLGVALATADRAAARRACWRSAFR